MPRMYGRLGWVAAVVLGAMFCAGAPSAAPLPAALEVLLFRADSLTQVGKSAAAARILDSLDAAATAREDARLRNAVQLHRARGAVGTQRLDDGERLLTPLIPRLRAARDTLLWVRAMRAQGRLLALRGRPRESGSAYRAAIRTARAAGYRAEEASGELAMATNATEESRFADAAAGFRRAIALLGADGDPTNRMRAHAGLARNLAQLGRTEEARREHGAALEIAVRLVNLVQQSDTQFNLGTLEHRSGDISRAETHYREAMRIGRQLGWTEREAAAANTIAILRVNAGRHAEADSILASVLPVVFRPGAVSVGQRARVLCQIGIVRRLQGRVDDAVAWGRRATDASDSVTLVTAMDVTRPLVATLREAGRTAEGAELVESQLRRLETRLTPEARADLQLQRAKLLVAMGRGAEVIGVLAAAVAPRTPGGLDGYDQIHLMSDIGQVHATLGRRDSALFWHRRAMSAWEAWRGDTRDPAWRERYDNAAQDYATRYAAELLAGRAGRASLGEAFAALQRHRARTLAERVHDPERGRAALQTPVTARRLQGALGPGELFLDVHAAPETTIIIAVARDTLLAWGAPSRRALGGRLASLRDLLAEPASGANALRASAAASLGAELLGPGAGLIRRARTVVIAAGSFAQYPLGMLTAPGVPEPLAVRMAFVPSATLLVQSRSRTRAAGGGLLAIARTRDESGRELRGAREEAEWLAARFERVEARVDDDRLSPAKLGALAARAEVLHFAAHARDDARRPWRSGLLLGRPGDANPWLEAWDVARLHPAARLCVLTGCESVGGRGDFGETLEGLATAWLAAGVPTAIASQWDVDDASAAAFVREFYEALARGETAGAALRTAQERMRAAPATADPAHWAGYVTIGDPETRVTLRAR